MRTGKKIVFTTIGSLGDLHPCLALALEMQGRGCRVVIATLEFYGKTVEACGVEFRPIRPAIPIDQSLVKRIVAEDGAVFFIRDLLLANLGDTYEDLVAAVEGADLLVAGELVFAAPLVSEKLGVPWISVVLSPSSFASVYELFPRFSAHVGTNAARLLSSILLEISCLAMRSWARPVNQLRKQLGLPRNRYALSRDRLSPRLILGLFSSVLGGPQPDWPAAARVTGAVFYDGARVADGMSAELRAFLDDGEPPLVFTLGSSAVHCAGNFYEESAKAAAILGRRAVLLVGTNAVTDLPANVGAFGYEPYAEVFPRAAAVVHAAGAGSIAQVLRAGCPMLVLPFGGFDQPLNASRLQKLGLARILAPSEYTGARAAAEIAQLLNGLEYRDKAQQASLLVKSEQGLHVACEAIGNLIGSETKWVAHGT